MYKEAYFSENNVYKCAKYGFATISLIQKDSQ